MGRLDEFIQRFDSYNPAIQNDLVCDARGSFKFCMIVENKDTGYKKEYMFDDPSNVPTVLGNHELLKEDFSIELYDKGELMSRWPQKPKIG